MIPVVTLLRTNLVDVTPRGSARRLMIITPRGRVFGGIENADDPDRMVAGQYPLTVTRMASAKMKALWKPGTELFGHPANFAEQLRGCWAMGTAVPNGITHSGNAFEALWQEIGGWEDRKVVTFRCIEVYDYDYGNLAMFAPHQRWLKDRRASR